MIKIKNIEIQALENAGCNNGNYPSVEIAFDNRQVYHDITCRCHRGCSNTLCVDNLEEGDEFQDYEAFLDYVWEGRGCMNEKGKKALEKISDNLSKMSEFSKGYFVGFGDGLTEKEGEPDAEIFDDKADNE